MNQPGISRWVGLFAAVGLILGALGAGATAHIGSSHSPFATNRPDLTSVKIDAGEVDFCFDEEVLGPLTSGDFSLVGYDSTTEAQGDSAKLDATQNNCIQVDFAGARAEALFTIGLVDAGAVKSRAGTENLEASASLTGSTASGGGGHTTAPNLVDYDVDDASDEITYTFDQDVVCPGAPPPAFFGSFGFYRQAGQGGIGGREDGDSIADCDDDEVTVGFNAPGVDNVERVFVDGGGTGPCGLPSDTGPGACAHYEGQGDGETDSPDLVDANRTGDDQVTFTFDQDATVNSDDEFYVYAEDGAGFFGTTGSCDVDNDEIECDFVGIEDAADAELVLAGVNDGATDDVADPTLSNTVGSVPLGSGLVASGASDAPDLETCTTDPSNREASFVFDEPFLENSSLPQTFALFDADGSFSDGTDINDEVGNTLVVEFEADAFTDAVGCHADDGALEDSLTNLSPAASVGLPGVGPTPTTSPTGQPPECQKDPGAVCGSSGNDSLQGTSGDDVIYGGAGDDVIDGGGGNDKIFGGDGNDTLSGNEGGDEINGGNGDDVLVGGAGKDSLVGGEGADKIFGDDRASAGGQGQVQAAQTGDGADRIDGGGGEDSIKGGGGGDKVEGGSGSDTVAGQAGADKVRAGGEEDTVSGGDGGDKMWGDKGDDKLKGEAGDDTLYGGKGVNDFNGGAGKDHCILSNKKDDTKSCEKKTFNFTFNFFPFLTGRMAGEESR
ncbi:MAG: serralysin [Actinomycetota bacterium]|nr:serralysin [Actinomycetota bacterium]